LGRCKRTPLPLYKGKGKGAADEEESFSQKTWGQTSNKKNLKHEDRRKTAISAGSVKKKKNASRKLVTIAPDAKEKRGKAKARTPSFLYSLDRVKKVVGRRVSGAEGKTAEEKTEKKGRYHIKRPEKEGEREG